jgi:S-adenosylmethionine hydrolase
MAALNSLHRMTTIALLTDFGTRDHYAAAMKGVLASRCTAPIHDLTHEVEPFDVFGAAWFLHEVERWWPAGTIFVCVIDPGVGTARRILAGRSKGRVFLAPDNGLLTFVEAEETRSVEDEWLFLPEGSSTFHGRDRFAPVAAALACGLDFGRVGPEAGTIERLQYEQPSYGDPVTGTVVRIDRFGNVITDIEADRIPFEHYSAYAGGSKIERRARTYGEGGDEPFLIVGSSRTVEISIRGGSAAGRLGISRQDRIALRPNV